jgi:hypothetical protein
LHPEEVARLAERPQDVPAEGGAQLAPLLLFIRGLRALLFRHHLPSQVAVEEVWRPGADTAGPRELGAPGRAGWRASDEVVGDVVAGQDGHEGRPLPLAGVHRYLRWRILARMRRFFRPTLRRPLRFFIGVTDLS